MTCMGVRVLCTLRSQCPNLKQYVRNASMSTDFLPQICKEGPRSHNFYQYQAKRYRTCNRGDPCVKKQQELAQKKRKEEADSKSFWKSLFAPKKKKPPIQTCRRLQTLKQWQVEPIPEFIMEMCKDLPEGSCIYKTRGHAFILEVPCQRTMEKKKTRSEVQLSKIERDKRALILEDETNPMPSYSSVGQRLLDLHDRKLHPLYKKLEEPLSNRPKPWLLETKSRCVSDAADKTKMSNWDLYYNRKKTSFADFKMTVLPRYLQTKEMEHKINTCSGLEFRKEIMRKCKDGKGVFKECPFPQCELDCERWNNQKPRK